MASIRADVLIAADADAVWDAVRDVAAVHIRLARGFVADVRMVAEDVREVTFASGAVVHERIIDIDEEGRRLAYSATGGRAEHHNASIEVRADAPGCTLLTWITDVWPHAAAAPIATMVEQGVAAIRATLEG